MKTKLRNVALSVLILGTLLYADNTFGSVTGSTLKGTGLANYHTDDVFGIYANPAHIVKQKKSIIVELGAPAATNAGYLGAGIMELNNSMVLGIAAGRQDTSGVTTHYTGLVAPRVVDMFWGMRMQGLDIGSRVTLGGTSSGGKSDITGNDTTQGVAALSLDVGIKLTDTPISAGVQMDITSAAQSSGAIATTTTQEAKPFNLVAHTQYDMNTSSSASMLFTLFMRMQDVGYKNTGATTNELIDKGTRIGVDVAHKERNDEKSLMILRTALILGFDEEQNGDTI